MFISSTSNLGYYDFAIGNPHEALDFSTASFIVSITEEGSEAPNKAVPATITFEPEGENLPHVSGFDLR